MRIGVFIGSFNPIHIIHEKIVKDLANDELDKVIVIPANEKYHLKNGLEKFEHRLNMLNLVFNSNSIIVSDLEKEEYHFTYQNIEILKKIYPLDELYLIIGADNLIELNTWKNYKYLLDTCGFVVFGRNDIKIEEYINNTFTNYSNKFIIKEEIENISSTLIRNKLKRKENVELYLNKKIIDYIYQNKLYGVSENEC